MVTLSALRTTEPLTDTALPDRDAKLLDFDDPDGNAHVIMREARDGMELSRRALGEMLRPPAPEGTIVKWERGDTKPKSPRREQIAEILNLRLPGQNFAEGHGASILPIHAASDSLSRAEAMILEAQVNLGQALGLLASLRAQK